jgi:hypothetical protein
VQAKKPALTCATMSVADKEIKFNKFVDLGETSVRMGDELVTWIYAGALSSYNGSSNSEWRG